MLVKQEQLNPCEVELHIEIEAEKVIAAIDKAYIDMGKMVNIPGFRKGKASKAILEKFLDQDKVKEHAADQLLQTAFVAALDEAKLEPYAPADVDVTKYEIGEPLTFTAKIPLAPKVELGKYTGLDVEKTSVSIDDDQVTKEIDQMRARHAEYPEVTDRGAQLGDVVRIETKAENEPDEEPKSNVAKIGENLPDFDAGLTGMKTDEEKTIEVAYPEDYASEELRGKTVPVHVKMLEVREEKLPELTDDWVKTAIGGIKEDGEEPSADAVDSVEKLRTKVREVLTSTAEEAADTEVKNKIVHAAVEGSEVCFPQVMVDEAINDHLEEMLENLKQRKLTIEDYLKYKNITMEDLQGQFEQESRHEIKARLVLREIVDKEDIKVEEDDIRAELQAMADENHVPVATITAYVEKTNSAPVVRNRVLTKKVMDFLVQASNIKNIG